MATKGSSKALAVSSILGLAACSITGYCSYSLYHQKQEEALGTKRELDEIQKRHQAVCSQHASTKMELESLCHESRNKEKSHRASLQKYKAQAAEQSKLMAAVKREKQQLVLDNHTINQSVSGIRDAQQKTLVQITAVLGSDGSAQDAIKGVTKLAQHYQDSQASNEQLESTILSLSKTSKLLEDHKEEEIREIKQQNQALQGKQQQLKQQFDSLRIELATVTQTEQALQRQIEAEREVVAEWRFKFQRQSEEAEVREREISEMKQVLENILNETAEASEQYQELLTMQDSMKSVEPRDSLKEQIEACDALRQALSSTTFRAHNLSSAYAEASEEMKEADMSEILQ